MTISPAQFQGQAIRRVYDEATETWWFSVVDVVQVLTDQARGGHASAVPARSGFS